MKSHCTAATHTKYNWRLGSYTSCNRLLQISSEEAANVLLCAADNKRSSISRTQLSDTGVSDKTDRQIAQDVTGHRLVDKHVVLQSMTKPTDKCNQKTWHVFTHVKMKENNQRTLEVDEPMEGDRTVDKTFLLDVIFSTSSRPTFTSWNV